MFRKTIIPVFMSAVILFSGAFTPKANAGFIEQYAESSFYQFVVQGSLAAIGTGIGVYYGQPIIGGILGEAVGAGVTNLAQLYAAGYSDDDFRKGFAEYTDSLQSDFGSYVYTSDGIIFYLTPDPKTDWTAQYFYTDGAYFKIGPWATGGNQNYVYFDDNKFVCPITGTYTAYVDVTYTYDSIGFSYGPTNKNAGGTITPPALYLYKSSTSELYMAEGYCGFRCVPADTTTVTSRIPVESRPTTLVAPLGYRDSNNTMQVVTDTTIVNETNNTYYNPVTNTNLNFTDWAFDYSTRTYTITLEDGTTVTVEYGDENITIHEGDTVYNVYYLIPTESPDDPGDTPGGDSGDIVPSGFWDWWKNAWESFTDKLFAVLGSPDSPDSETLPGGDDDPETEEDEGWGFIDLLIILRDGTWSIVKGVVRVGVGGVTGLVQSVSNFGNFFDMYDDTNADGVLGLFTYEGADVWD